jgi:precorrin-6A/cobalt-precorrin-6A reductase
MSRSSTAWVSLKGKPVGERRHLLILGGTAEARVLAERATAVFGRSLRVTTSLAGRTRSHAALAGEVRSGGFGGSDGLAAYLRAASVDWVVDATHPFATRISTAATAACGALGVPLLSLARPPWIPQPGDHWIDAASAAEAAAIVPGRGRRAFLTIGHSELQAFSGITSVHFVVRLVDPPAAALPLASYELILARGPFAIETERLTMASHAIDIVVAKASGGASTVAKLDAARELGIPVVMLRRPEHQHAERVERVEDALAWIERQLRQEAEVAR